MSMKGSIEQARAAASGGSTTSTLASSMGTCHRKRNALSPQEECLIIELHARWGNRWSRIAQRLLGHIDNEIKNYWRTHMRKKAQERKTNMSPSFSSSSLTYQSSLLRTTTIIGMKGDTHNGSSNITSVLRSNQNVMDGYPMDQIWRKIEVPQAPTMLGINEGRDDKTCNNLTCPLLSYAISDYSCLEVLWKMDDEEIKMLAWQYGYGT